MSSEEDWDVEKHKTEYECDEHWELKRKFLLAHKDNFPEDELVCLAQVFINVEILGCRYSKEIMQLIAELSKDIIGDYREKQKTKLQRTFVKASDSANSKVKGLIPPKTTHKVDAEAKSGCSKVLDQSDSNEIFAKRRKLDEPSYGDIVLIDRPGSMPQNTLACAINASGGNIEWKFDRINETCKCSVFINSKLLAEASDSNQKVAKKEAAIAGIRELQRHYYTIKIKHNMNGDTNVTATSMSKDTTTEESISDDNIGKKLMKLMGWSGGGLGKSEQGIVEPITVKQQICRQGLGLKSTSCTMNDLKFKAKKKMRKYLASDMRSDLIFSADFTNEERAVIHQVARQLGLKSHSYGPKNQRVLVVSRKIDVRDLIEELRSLGGKTNKYELIEPTES